MAEPAADLSTASAPAESRRPKQRAILDAARRVLLRDGAPALTLEKVAAEGGLNLELVKDRFHTSDELLLGLAVAELMGVARAMRTDEAAPGAWAKTSGDALGLVQSIAAALNPPAEPAAPKANDDSNVGDLGDRIRAIGEKQANAAADLVAALEAASTHLSALDGTAPEAGTAGTASYLANARRAANAGATPAPAPGNKKAAPVAAEGKRKSRKILLAALVPVPLLAAGFLLFNQTAVRPAAAPPRVASIAAPARPATLSPLERLTQAADRGDADAELLLGLKYLQGDGIAKDQSQALHWLQRAAEGGQAVAQYRLANLYAPEDSVLYNPGEAARWYQVSAAQGNLQAMNNLAVSYAQGAGVVKDMSQAAEWFTKAAALGYTTAEFNLAVLYERGEGVERSVADAYKWYALAAASGDGEARSRLEALSRDMSPSQLMAAQRAAQGFKPAPTNVQANSVPALTGVAGT